MPVDQGQNTVELVAHISTLEVAHGIKNFG
jgi:hypothetical protein